MSLDESLTSQITTAVDTAVLEMTSKDGVTKDDAGKEVQADEQKREEDGQAQDSETPQATSEKEDGKVEKVEETPQEPAEREISEETLVRAVRAGLSLSDARSFASEESLQRVLEAIERPHGKVKADEEKRDEKKATEVDLLESLPKLDPDVYEPEVVKVFDVLVGELKRQRTMIQEFKTSQEQTARTAAEASAREVERWFDKQVAELGDEFHDSLGAGEYGSLSQGSSQRAKRDAIADQIGILLAGYQASGKQAPPRETVFQTAARLVLQDEYQRIHDNEVSGELEKRSKQHLQRVGGQKVKNTQTPEEEAAGLLGEKFGI